MKKFDIQRFAKRRIQVGDNLDNRTIYFDWPTNYLPSTTGTMGVSFINGEYSNFYEQPNGENPSDTQIIISGDLLRIVYDPDDTNNQLEQTDIGDGDIGIISSINSDNSSYRCCYIEDSHVRPLKIGDEITTDTKFYFNIPDDIELSLTGAPTDNYNVVSLDGDNGFVINCINNSSQQMIRFSNSMGSTEDGTIYEKIDGVLNTNKSLMENITTMDSNWVGTVKELKVDTPIYELILVDETTLGNYVSSYEKRSIQIGDNLSNETVYCDLNNIPFYSFTDDNTGNFVITNNNSVLLSTPYNIDTRTGTVEYKMEGEVPEILLKSTYDDHGAINSALKQLSSDFGIVSEIDTNNIGYPLVSIKNPNIRQIQVGDKITNNTKFYFKFPNNINKYISTNISSFSYIFTVQGEGSGYKAGLWVFNEDGLATTGEQKISLVGEGWSPIKKDIYKYESNKNVTNETEYTFIENFGKINEIDNELSKYVLVDITTLEQEPPAPTTSTGTVSYKNGGNWNKLLLLAQEQVPLKGSIMPGPIKWSAVNSTTECTDSKTLYFVFGEEETNPTYDTVSMKYTISNSAYNTANISSIGLMFNNDSNSKTILNYNNESSSLLPGIETKYINNTLPQIFIDYTGKQLTVYGEIVVRDPETTGLLYNFALNKQNVLSGSIITFEPDSSGISFSEAIHSGSVSCTLYINPVGDHGHGCLSGDTKIKTLNNDIYISDLELGDKVIDKDSQETEITKIYNHKIDTVYQIHLNNDETIECSYDHKFLVNGGKAVTAAQLKENDKLGQHTITSIDIINKELDVYEIKTESNTYTLANGIICECENI